MDQVQKIKDNSDSLIELLAAQCMDLEILLGLAQKETTAAQERDFETILDIVTERTTIGNRLAVYQQQISELRGFLGGHELEDIGVSNQIMRLVEETLIQDRKTKKLLTGLREETAENLRHLENGKRSVNGYLQGMQKGLSYSQSF